MSGKGMLVPGIALMLCVSCIPIKHYEYHLRTDDSVNVQKIWNSSMSTIYLEFEKIWLSAIVTTSYIQFSVNVPENQNVQLDGRSIEISLMDKMGVPRVISFDLIPVPAEFGSIIQIGYLVNYYDSQYEKPNPLDNFGLLTGGTKVRNYPLNKNFVCHKGYFFKVPFGIPLNSNGSIRFPDMTINGHAYRGPRINFAEKEGWIIQPINGN